MWEFIRDIKHPQKRKTNEDKISYCHKYLHVRSLYYYLNKWIFKMNTYSFMSKCFHLSLTSTEKNGFLRQQPFFYRGGGAWDFFEKNILMP